MKIDYPKIVDIPEGRRLIGLESALLITAPTREWNDYDQDQIRKDYKKALEITMRDQLFSGINQRQIEFQFKRIIKSREKDFEEKSKNSREIKEFMGAVPGDIYVFPLYRELEKGCSSDREKIVLESQFAHELFHREQEGRGLNKKFPFAVEGPAWTLQLLYGAKEIGINDYLKSFNKFTGRFRSDAK